ncbi:hypothetical protein D1AOALGA4SA_6674 [Olavius algarvensis Delta 1 endosymbiont]|nr:hypothetical protein D1AOALGA4SA_6674 [Olavius algarvensis Delta 1 endosymbiont]
MGGSLLFVFISTAYGTTNFTIGWDPNSENNIDGYGIYVRRGSPGPPYEHVGDVFLDELSDLDAPQFRIIEIDHGTYYVAATAFDKEGNESSFSDSLCISVSENTVSECPSDKSSENAVTYGFSGGRGGGGGGCLISSAGEQFGSSKTIGLTLLIGLFLVNFAALIYRFERIKEKG